MSMLGGHAAGLAFLPEWLTDTRDPAAFDALLVGWVKASGWRGVGVIWPGDAPHGLLRIAKPTGVERPTQTPAELADVRQTLTQGQPTAVWQMPHSAGRLYTLFHPLGRMPGVLWAERAGDPWSEAERNAFRLAARLVERSPALAQVIGPLVDSERLQQRLTDTAVIAGRMAHDFDNILTGIIGFADLSVPLLPPGSQPAKFVAEIGKVGQRGIVFTQQLHQLSQAGRGKPVPGSLAAALSKEEAKLKPQLAAGVRLATELPPHLPHVAMDAVPLATVVGHLLANAVEATPAGGEVRAAVELVELSAEDAKSYLGQVSPGPHVQFTVQDAGPGMKPEVRAKLFVEPFYTTKVRHRGLGLAIVYRALSAHRGGIRIEPNPPGSTGTLVRIVIPPAAVRPTLAPALASPPLIGG